MARLGSVLGAILAELTRARLVADELTKDLVSEYRDDPVLASMTVPRVVLDEVALTLRFGVSDLEEAPGLAPDAESVRAEWVGHAGSTVLPRVLDRLGVPAAERSTVIDAIADAAGKPVGSPPLIDVRRAIAGERKKMAQASAQPLVDAWSALPTGVRSTLGAKTAFRRELEQIMRRELDLFIDRQFEMNLVKVALASRIDVAVIAQELPQDPNLVQELRITVRGEDLDLVVETRGNG